ncbi:FG-GAP repeat domain-containing protein [Paenibacillus silvisoli]|uniref:FG-GAP repeat domain-containing protein n=1 Tax=Paenibacillus silvisoli TaxID=3110539 RepID=UPI0028049911|nr:VCBS repeat-containing protein [Paenibacillus silvisoli]
MYIPRWITRAALLVCLLVLTGCQITATPADLLLNPRSTPENAALASAVREQLPPRTKLSLAMQEPANSAVLQMDVDGDGKREAFVVYSDEAGTEHVMMLRSVEGTWKQWFTFAESSNYGVDVLRVADLDRDGKTELMIGWNQYGEPQHMLTLYHIDLAAPFDQPPNPLVELPYDTMGTGDADGDGNAELALIQLQRQKMTASIGIYRLYGDRLDKMASAMLDGSVNEYLQLKLGKIAPNRYGVLADAAIGADASTTTMLAWEGGELKVIYPPMETGDDNVQINANVQLSGDGNGDGIMELHTLREAPGQSEGVAYSDLLWIEQHKQWNGADAFDVVNERYVDAYHSYALQLPMSWKDYTFRRLTDGSVDDVALDRYVEETNTREEILALRVIAVADWNKTEQQLQEEGRRYMPLGSGSGLVYVAVWHDLLPKDEGEEGEQRVAAAEGAFPPDEAELKRLFKLLPEE